MRTVFVAEPGAAVRACADRRYTRSGRAMRSISCREDAAVLRAVRVPACAFVRRRELRAIRHAAVGGGSSRAIRAIRAAEGVVCLFPSGGGGTLSAVVRFRISFRARVSGPNSEHAPRNFEKFTGNWKIRKRRIAYCRIFVTFALPIPVFSTYGMPGWRNR